MNNTEQLTDISNWSAEEFGHAELGNKARTRRLEMMAERMAVAPAGKVTEVFKDSAPREGAYKFLENTAIKPDAIGEASHRACAARCAGESFVFVPVDGSSLNIADPDKTKKGLGPIGTRSQKGRGLEVMSAIAVRIDGTPMGICGQAYWARSEKKDKRHNRKKTLKEKETRYWFEAIEQTVKAFDNSAPECVPWFQLDRGGDFREMLNWAAETDNLVTIRAAQDRRLVDEETRYLWEMVESQEPIGHYDLKVIGGHNRKARQADMEVRTAEVTVRLRNAWLKTSKPVTLHVVHTKEIGTTPLNEKPIEWLLLTNYPVHTFVEASLVIFGYSQRWRIEEFHKGWKSMCSVEDTLLEEASRIIKWAIMLAAVAMRTERLKYLARTTPDEPASVELTRYEIDAIIVLKEPKGYKLGDMPTIGLAVRWLADLGGYTGKSSGGPPGSIVIGRGLKYIASAAKVMRKTSEN